MLLILSFIGFVLTLIGIILVSHSMGKWGYSSYDDYLFLGLFILSLLFCVAYFTSEIVEDISAEQYRQGQIDAISGDVQYELKQNEDSSVTWQKINKGE